MKENIKLLMPISFLWVVMLVGMSSILLNGCTLSYTVTQAHGSGSDIVDEDQKTDAKPNFTIPNPLNVLKT
jgi:hypothetical protein